MTDDQRQFHITAGTIGQFAGGDAAIDGTVNLGTISGNVTNAINQLPASTQSDSLGLKEILSELQEAISIECTLSDEDKFEALEEVKKLAEAGQNPNDGNMKKLAKRATRMLKGITDSLPDATKFAEACSKLLPIISGIFGLN